MAKVLIDAGADVESKDRYGQTPLMICIFFIYAFHLNDLFFFLKASEKGSIEVAKLLVEKGASVKPVEFLNSQNALKTKSN